MANKEHLERLNQGVAAWNEWRKANPEIRPNLSEASFSRLSYNRTYYTTPHITGHHLSGVDFSKTSLSEANFHCADLTGADFTEAYASGATLPSADLFEAKLIKACFSRADLSEVNLTSADLTEVDLTDADLREAHLTGANLTRANLAGSNLVQADLTGTNLAQANLAGADLMESCFFGANLAQAGLIGARLMRTNFEGANLTGCSIYGISAWDVNLVGAQQSDLVITLPDEPVITVDNLEVAQFIYLLLNNEKIRQVIDTITSKAVLIMGRFTPERKAVLDAIREELRRRNYLPILFDFEQPTARDFTETIMTLAGMCLFIIADITNPKSSPLELQATIPNYMVPFVPIIHEGEQPFSMFRDLKNKHPDWVLDVLAYDSAASLVRRLGNAVIRPALKKHDELLVKKVQELQIRHVKDYPDDEELV